MSDAAITVEDLGKQYRIGGPQARYKTMRDLITDAMAAPFKKAAKLLRGHAYGAAELNEIIWALKDISFEVERGDVVGIIGLNGAGKSTLLKILSRITEPTEGRIKLHGKVGSLLEVGTGFHSELTGRENIYLNGAILGMKRGEIDKKFDEIVAFSEIEKFIDTPAKHYSSGMYARLAFAVASHMDPEILLVDEVLAVGDIGFQKKCLGKMGNVAKEGRTVLFVSHNMAAVSALCSKGILLDKGRLVYLGEVSEAIKKYMQEFDVAVSSEWIGNEGDENVRLLHTWVKSLDPDRQIHTAADIEIGIEAEVLNEVNGIILGFTLFSEHGYELAYVLYDDALPPPPESVKPGKLAKTFVIPANTLAQGTYKVEFDVGIHMRHKIISEQGMLKFTLENTIGIGRRFPVPKVRGRTGIFRPEIFING
jgi:lipopolysaccharide transport system ATP-binding protein